VSFEAIGRHALVDRVHLDKDLLEAVANSSFRVLEIALVMLSWLSSLAEASPSRRRQYPYSVTGRRVRRPFPGHGPSDIREVPCGQEALFPQLIGDSAMAVTVSPSPITGDFLLLTRDDSLKIETGGASI
jgi:hypothetical protein